MFINNDGHGFGGTVESEYPPKETIDAIIAIMHEAFNTQSRNYFLY